MKLELNTVYNISKTTRWDRNQIHRGLLPTLYIDSGSVAIYVSNSNTKPIDETEMISDPNDIIEPGKIYKINAMFKWLLLKQLDGVTNNILSEGLIDGNN